MSQAIDEKESGDFICPTRSGIDAAGNVRDVFCVGRVCMSWCAISLGMDLGLGCCGLSTTNHKAD